MNPTIATMRLASADIADGATMPTAQLYNGMGLNGGNISPSLNWSSVPAGTKSLAVAMYDPDAPTTVGFTHWILFNLDSDLTMLEAGAGRPHHEPHGSTLGLNDFADAEYMGPCPPPGPAHRYQITVYALDLPKIDSPGHKTTYAKFRFLIRDHILAQGTLTAMFGVSA